MSNLEDSRKFEIQNLLDTSKKSQDKDKNKIYQLSNPVVYYSALVEKSLIFFIFGIICYQIGFYIDIFCNNNKLNCSIKSKKVLQANMNSINYILSILAFLTYPLTVEYDNKAVYNISKLMFAVSILLFCFGGFWGMYLGRILMGFFAEYSHVYAHWMIYQIALPQHREAAVATMMISMSFYMTGFCYFSYLDGGGHWTWRVVNSVPAVMLILMVFVDFTLLRNVNGFEYLLQNMTKKEVIEQLSTYFEEGTAELMLLNNQVRKPRLQNRGIEVLSEESNREEASVWQKIKDKRSQIINCSIIAVCFMFGLSDPFITNSVFIGSHLLVNTKDVKASKLMMFYGSVGFLITSIILPILKLNKKRKLLFILSMLVSPLCYVISALGYKLNQLWLVRSTYIPIAVANGFLYNSYLLYVADLCSMDVISIPLVSLRLILALTQYLLPVFMSFEESDKSQISARFYVLATISGVSTLIAQFVMIETDGLAPDEIEKAVKGHNLGVRSTEIAERDF